MQQTALILGPSGKIGHHFAAAFERAGWTVRRYQRGTDMSAAALGCDVIVNGLNPPAYHDWAGQLPAITTQVIAAARASGATILFPGNVYVFGHEAAPWSAQTPHRPVSRKGAIRAAVEARYKAAVDVQTIILRAGDFLTPEVSDTVLDMVYLRNLSKGVITSLGDPDVPRAYAWLPDMARAAVMLAERRAQLPAFNDVAFPGTTVSVTDLAKGLGAALSRDMKVKQFGWWMFAVAAPFWELAREMREMRYLYDHPHWLSGETLARLLPDFAPTATGQILAEIAQARRREE